jgi:GGDEF domain-containing protein
MTRKSRVVFESEISRILMSAETVDLTVHRFAGQLSEFLENSAVSVYLYEPEAGQLFLKGTSRTISSGGKAFRFSAEGTIPSLAIHEKRVLSLREVRRPEGSSLEADCHVFPMQEEEVVLGVVTIEHVAPGNLGVVQLDVARRAVKQLSAIVGKAKREAELSMRMAKISAINEAGVTLVSNKDLPELLKICTAVTSLIMGAGSCIIRTYDEGTDSYVPGDYYGLSDPELRKNVLALDHLVNRKVLEEGQPVLVRDLSRRKDLREYAREVRTLLCHPLKAEGDIVGTMTIFNKSTGNTFTPPYFTDRDMGDMARLLKYVETAIAEAMKHDMASGCQERDEMTGLPNMRHFGSRLRAEISRARRFGSRMVILACETNLRQGGESLKFRNRYRKIMRRVVEAIESSLREYDVIAAMDEGMFVMILPQAEDGTVSATVRMEVAVEQALREFREKTPGAVPDISFSRVLYPEDGEDVGTLMAGLKPV